MTPKKVELKNTIKELQQESLEHAADFFATAAKFYTNDTPPSQRQHHADEVWITPHDGYEGQLAVDVYHDANTVYIKAIIGGIQAEDIEVHLNNDMVTIKGKRIQPNADITPDHYYIQECYWGGFSRSIILPIDIQNDKVDAAIEHGVLLVTLPKSDRPKNTRIPIKKMR